VKTLCASEIGERYCVGPTAPWKYPRETQLVEIVSKTRGLASKIFGGQETTVGPLSGSQCVAAIVLGICKPGDVVMGLGASDGGHWALGSMAEKMQCRFEPLPLSARSKIDGDKLARLVKANQPKLVMVDPSHSLETIAPESIRSVLPANVPLFYDISHFMGLVPHQYLRDPFKRGVTVLHGSCHKSFFGPQKGLIVFGREAGPDLVTQITAAAEKILSSNIHLHHVAALGMALEELETFGEAYAAAIVKHAQLFAQTLHNHGVDVLQTPDAFTHSHQVMAKVGGNVELVWNALAAAGILTNCIRLPREDSLGFRFGLAEVTRLGYTAPEIEAVGTLAARIVKSPGDSSPAKAAVKELATKARTMQFCF
jgi:glycine hydroxymethyltransferase